MSGTSADRPTVVVGVSQTSHSPAAERSSAQADLEADVAETLGTDHGASCEVHEGSALSVLEQVSTAASLLVLDAPRRTDLSTSPMLAHRLVYRASCPVVIMPPRLTR